MGPKVSWVILTYNRAEIVRQAIGHCLDNSGAPEAINQIVWVDNGSTDGVREVMASFEPEISVLNSENLGVAKGYNQGLGLATEEYIIVTGCDFLMPDNWLRTFLEYVTKIPETGMACMYSKHWTYCHDRLRKSYGVQMVNGLPIVHAMPLERHIMRRSLLADFGYFPETFGMYGFDDVARAHRIEQVCDEKGLLYYCIPDCVPVHLGTEGLKQHDGKDSAEYHAMKRKEATDPAKHAELNRLRDLGWPRFSPFP